MSRRVLSIHKRLQHQRLCKVKQYIRNHKKVEKDIQDKIEMCIKEINNPLYKIFNIIRYKLGILK